MAEREKVIEAVECCFHLGSKGCQSCPYVSEVDLEHGCTVDLAGRIIAQLKAPEPVVRCENCQFFGKVEYWPDGTKKVCQLLKRQVLENSFCCWGMKKEAEDG